MKNERQSQWPLLVILPVVSVKIPGILGENKPRLVANASHSFMGQDGIAGRAPIVLLSTQRVWGLHSLKYSETLRGHHEVCLPMRYDLLP